ncbi:hypothetical protein [Vulcanisaeta thermophila]|uniref:hypothetical protein n=1 Tax=Vulcanisaeta thermophila TaxID=867917 RepID=UPI0008536DF1|nr:hypothetical protein [Vulcanisaeta thermophila]
MPADPQRPGGGIIKLRGVQGTEDFIRRIGGADSGIDVRVMDLERLIAPLRPYLTQVPNEGA